MVRHTFERSKSAKNDANARVSYVDPSFIQNMGRRWAEIIEIQIVMKTKMEQDLHDRDICDTRLWSKTFDEIQTQIQIQMQIHTNQTQIQIQYANTNDQIQNKLKDILYDLHDRDDASVTRLCWHKN